MNIKSISFIGLGLIGGSVAQAVKKFHPDIKMYAHASENTINEAFSDGIIENSCVLSMEELCKRDMIILCCPVDTNIVYLRKLIPYLTNNHIVTDVGSVKGDIHHAVRSMKITDIFVGGHPMAGSEKAGYKYAYPDLIKGCRYILTTDDGNETERERVLWDFVKSLGCNPMHLSFNEHDKSAAAISHLPHALSSALTHYVMRSDSTGSMKNMASSGFRDTTRIAAGSPDMWEQIFMANYEALLDLVRGYGRELRILEELIENNDQKGLIEYLKEAKDYRDGFN